MKYIIILFCSIILQNLCLTFDLIDDYTFEPSENYNSSYLLRPTITYIPSSIQTNISIYSVYNYDYTDIYLIVFITSIGSILLIILILCYTYHYKNKIKSIYIESLDHEFGTIFILDNT